MRALLMLAILPLTACQSKWEHDANSVPASGSGASRTYQASGFTGVDLRGSDDVEVRTADAFSVRAEGDSEVLDDLEIVVKDGTLRVGRKGSSNWFQHHRGHGKVFVTLPRLDKASVAGSGDLTIDRAEGDFSGSIAGSGNLKVGTYTGGRANLSIAGAGDVTIGGRATSLTIAIAGSGDVDARQLTAASADVSIAGSGDVRGVVAGPAKVSIIGSGDVYLSGGAQCDVSKLGSGDAHCS